MYVKKLLADTLAGIIFGGKNVPACKLKYTGSEKTYIQFYMLLEDPFDSDGETTTDSIIYFTVDIFTDKAEYDSLIEEVKTRLIRAGYSITNIGPETFESGTAIYHITLDCSIENYEL